MWVCCWCCDGVVTRHQAAPAVPWSSGLPDPPRPPQPPLSAQLSTSSRQWLWGCIGRVNLQSPLHSKVIRTMFSLNWVHSEFSLIPYTTLMLYQSAVAVCPRGKLGQVAASRGRHRAHRAGRHCHTPGNMRGWGETELKLIHDRVSVSLPSKNLFYNFINEKHLHFGLCYDFI